MNKLILSLALMLGCITTLHAETRYVTDQFKITMRTGESATHKILRMLRSGEAVEVLASNAETGYSEVRTQGGQTGFVLTRQLMSIPSARDRLTKAEAKLASLMEEPGKLAAQLETLKQNHESLSEEHRQVTKAKESLQQELDEIRRTAADAIRTAKERTELSKNVIALTREVENLKQMNRDLKNENLSNTLIAGAGIIFVGILLGLILPRLHIRKRRDSWDTL